MALRCLSKRGWWKYEREEYRVRANYSSSFTWLLNGLFIGPLIRYNDVITLSRIQHVRDDISTSVCFSEDWRRVSEDRLSILQSVMWTCSPHHEEVKSSTRLISNVRQQMPIMWLLKGDVGCAVLGGKVSLSISLQGVGSAYVGGESESRHVKWWRVEVECHSIECTCWSISGTFFGQYCSE